MTQKEVLRLLKTQKNVFITGEAGTGKSYLINQYIEYCKENSLQVLVAAPTGIAAINVGGETMHRAFGIPIPAYGHTENDIKDSTIKSAIAADVIIIDEVSMCRNDVFEYFCMVLDYIKKKFNKKQKVVLVGDFYQLPPIVKKDEDKMFKRYALDPSGYVFTTPAWQKLKLSIAVLDKIYRQDDSEFLENLRKVKVNDISCLEYFNKHVSSDRPDDAIYICSTNQQAKEINDEKLSLVESMPTCYTGKKKGFWKGDLPADEIILLKLGCRVMITVNDVIDNQYQNGSIGTVISLYEKKAIIRLDNGQTVSITPHEYKMYKYNVNGGLLEKKELGSFVQMPLKLAYAITMHKTQGQTYDKVCISPSSFASGQLYVALSRVKSPEGLFLSEPIKESDILISKEVFEFVKNNYQWDIPKSIIEKKKKIKERQLKKIKEKATKKKKKVSKKKPTSKTKKLAKSTTKVSKSSSNKKTTKSKTSSSKKKTTTKKKSTTKKKAPAKKKTTKK